MEVLTMLSTIGFKRRIKVKKLTLIVLLMVPALFCYGQIAETAPKELRALNYNTTAIFGKVIDESKQPVSGIKLELELAPEVELQSELNLSGIKLREAIEQLKSSVGDGIYATVSSDEKGEYNIKGVPIPGVYYIYVRNDENYLPTRIKLWLNPSEKKKYMAPNIILTTRSAMPEMLPQEVIAAVKNARAAASANNYDSAISNMQRALELKPDYAEGHYNLAIFYLSKKDSTSAVSHLKKALELKNDYLPALITLGEVSFYNLKDYSTAADSFEQYLTKLENQGGLSIEDARVLALAGNSYKMLGNWEKALHRFDKYFEIKTKAESLGNKDARLAGSLGSYFYKKKEMDKALKYFLKSTEIDPRFNPEIYMYLGNCYLAKRDGQNAYKFYRIYIALDRNGKYAPQVKELLNKMVVKKNDKK
jgi:tetratricopeptide (TPR) repeat protein